jgi:hypothetical protein
VEEQALVRRVFEAAAESKRTLASVAEQAAAEEKLETT